MGALAAMTCDTEIKAYYHRKVEEGKSKMSVINNIRNKLIHRVCTVIKRQQPYLKTTAYLKIYFNIYLLVLPWKSVTDVVTSYWLSSSCLNFVISDK